MHGPRGPAGANLQMGRVSDSRTSVPIVESTAMSSNPPQKMSELLQVPSPVLSRHRVERQRLSEALNEWLSSAIPALLVTGRLGSGSTTALRELADRAARTNTDTIVVALASPPDWSAWSAYGRSGAPLRTTQDLVEHLVDVASSSADPGLLDRAWRPGFAPTGSVADVRIGDVGGDAQVIGVGLTQYFATVRPDFDLTLAALAHLLTCGRPGQTLLVVVDGLADLNHRDRSDQLTAVVQMLIDAGRVPGGPIVRLVVGTEPDTSVVAAVHGRNASACARVDLDAIGTHPTEHDYHLEYATAVLGSSAIARKVVDGADSRWASVVDACEMVVHGRLHDPWITSSTLERLVTRGEVLRQTPEFASVLQPALEFLVHACTDGLPIDLLTFLIDPDGAGVLDTIDRHLRSWLRDDLRHHEHVVLLREVRRWISGDGDPFHISLANVHQRIAERLDAPARSGPLGHAEYAVRHAMEHWTLALESTSGPRIAELVPSAISLLNDREWQRRLSDLAGTATARAQWVDYLRRLGKASRVEIEAQWHDVAALAALDADTGHGRRFGVARPLAFTIQPRVAMPRASGQEISEFASADDLGISLRRSTATDGSTRLDLHGSAVWFGRCALVSVDVDAKGAVSVLTPLGPQDGRGALLIGGVDPTRTTIEVAPVPLAPGILGGIDLELLTRSASASGSDATRDAWRRLAELLPPRCAEAIDRGLTRR